MHFQLFVIINSSLRRRAGNLRQLSRQGQRNNRNMIVDDGTGGLVVSYNNLGTKEVQLPNGQLYSSRPMAFKHRAMCAEFTEIVRRN